MNKLVRKEIVRRERTDEDRRLVYVALSKQGDELYRQIMSSHLELCRGMLEALDAEEQDYLFNNFLRCGPNGSHFSPLSPDRKFKPYRF